MATAPSVIQPAPACTDRGLIAAVRNGSDRAFEELYSRYRARIGSYVFRIVGDHARAEDIAQEVFISALRRLRETERPIALKPWLYEIAKNACIDELRRSRRMREIPLETDADESGAPVLPGGTTLDAAVENKQRLADLRGAFHGLSESHHRILVMRELEGKSYLQIGAQLGMTRPMVESTLFRARRKLGEEYNELVSGRRCQQVQLTIEAEGERPLRSLGLRERRQLARRLAHCQPCRRHARMAGVDESFFQTPALIGKIAALLPFPWLRWRRSHHDGDQAAATGSHQLAALQSLPVMARLADPSTPMFGMGRATAAAATLLIAGASGGLVAGLGSGTDATTHHAAAKSASPRGSVARAIREGHAGAQRASSLGLAQKLSTSHGGGGGGASSSPRPTSAGAPSGAQGPGRQAAGGQAAGGQGTGGKGSGGQKARGSGSPLSSTAGGIGSTLHKVTSGASGTSNALSQVGSGASSALNQLGSGASNALGQVGSGASNAVGNVTSGAAGAVSQVGSGAAGAVGNVTSGVSGAVSQVGSGASGAVGKVTSGASGAVSQGGSGASTTVGKVTSGASTTAGNVTSGASDMATHVTSGAANTLGSLTKP